MKKQADLKNKQFKALSRAIGDFIHYWGFRRIHGQIWSQLYLSNEPLSGADLVKNIGVSKALVSPALKELIKHKVIFQVKSGDTRTKLYEANPDFMSVIRNVLENREFVMLQKVSQEFSKFSELQNSGSKSSLNQQRLESLGEMINQANSFITILCHAGDFSELGELVGPHTKSNGN
ncbi:hypothetical protein K2P97_11125 [bacterium]|nr:hypothetical protein [bacterium]